jgi:hypothetical protein
MACLGPLTAAVLIFLATPAFAQAPKDLGGSWTLESSTIQQGGSTTQPFGTEPKGALILETNGRYVAMIARAGLPKFAGDNRMAGTPDEYKAIVNGTIAHFGSYTVAGNVITFRIETSTYPNWDGTEQKRTYTLSGDTLTYTVGEASVGGGTAMLVWKRAK